MLRYRILKEGIHCLPWRIWNGEIKELPISSQTLFRRDGRPIDLLEKELKEEGYLLQSEQPLLEMLKDPNNLKQRPYFEEAQYTQNIEDFGGFPSDWAEEDYQHYFNNAEEKEEGIPF